MTFTTRNAFFMQRCFDIARLANPVFTSPNPAVGAVIVAPDGRIIGEGFTQPYGSHHGEVMAVASVKQCDRHLLSFSTIYVSLEPCFHFGKTPPCVDLILHEKIPNVVIAYTDPNPLVACKSITKLRENNVNIQIFNTNNVLTRQNTEGASFDKIFNADSTLNFVLTSIADAKQLENGKSATLLPFFTNMTKKRPFIILKWAQSADGFMGKTDEMVAISNAYSKRLVHKWRSEADAIMVGTATARLDNPELTNRFYYGKSPIRIVLDRHSTLSPALKLFDGSVKTLVFSENSRKNADFNESEIRNPKSEIENTEGSSNARLEHTIQTIQREFLPFDDFLLDSILTSIQKQRIGILFVEGGQKLLSSFIKRGLWDEARIITASKTLGEGIEAPRLLGGNLQQTIQLGDDTVNFIQIDRIKLNT